MLRTAVDCCKGMRNHPAVELSIRNRGKDRSLSQNGLQQLFPIHLTLNKLLKAMANMGAVEPNLPGAG